MGLVSHQILADCFVQVLQIEKGRILQLTAAVYSRGDLICLVLQHIWAGLLYTLKQQEVLCVFLCLGGLHPSGKLPPKQSVHKRNVPGNLYFSHTPRRGKEIKMENLHRADGSSPTEVRRLSSPCEAKWQSPSSSCQEWPLPQGLGNTLRL